MEGLLRPLSRLLVPLAWSFVRSALPIQTRLHPRAEHDWDTRAVALDEAAPVVRRFC
jgi:hypothetical protein